LWYGSMVFWLGFAPNFCPATLASVLEDCCKCLSWSIS